MSSELDKGPDAAVPPIRNALSVGPEGFEKYVRAAAAQASPDIDLDAMAFVFNLMRVQARVMKDLENNVHRPAGTSWPSFRLMGLLRAYGPSAVLDLAQAMDVSSPSVTSLVNTLERYGWVTRSRSSRDGRVVTVELTPRGIEVVDELQRRKNGREVEWANVLTPRELATFTRLLRKILERTPPPPETVGPRLSDR